MPGHRLAARRPPRALPGGRGGDRRGRAQPGRRRRQAPLVGDRGGAEAPALARGLHLGPRRPRLRPQPGERQPPARAGRWRGCSTGRVRWRVTAPARDYLHAIAPLHNQPLAPGASRHRRGDRGERPEGVPAARHGQPLPRHRAGHRAATAASGSTSSPRGRAARLDIRLLPDTDATAFLAEVSAALGTEFEVRVLVTSPPRRRRRRPPAASTQAMAAGARRRGAGGAHLHRPASPTRASSASAASPPTASRRSRSSRRGLARHPQRRRADPARARSTAASSACAAS